MTDVARTDRLDALIAKWRYVASREALSSYVVWQMCADELERAVRELVPVPPAPSGAPFSSPFNEILAERLAQDHQWGGSRHDDTHTTDDWSHYIQKQLNETEGGESHLSQARARYVKIAALAVAAAESIARRLEGVAAPAPSAPQPEQVGSKLNSSVAASGLSPSAETQSTK